MTKYVGISTLEVLEEAGNYNAWIAETFSSYLSSPLLEIGSGTGNISRFFTAFGIDILLSDVDEDLIRILQSKFTAKHVTVENFDITKSPPKHFLKKFSTIIGINVLEHIKNDVQTLIYLKECLNKDGKLLLLVPAKKWAFTKLDKELGHFRRYEKKEIEEKLQEAGYNVEKIYFFNFVGLLSWVVRDKIGRSVYLKPQHIKIFDKIVPVLRRVERIVKPPVGVSLIVIARKK